MIAFSCPCGQKFQVKPQFSGRKASCPTCKQPLIVPAFEPTHAYVPQGEIDGTASSLLQAGVPADVTLEQRRTGLPAGQPPLHELLARRGKGQRYVIAGEIARGGMGAVLRAVDCDIRREVAVKFMLNDKDPKHKLRFVEEAQITGQLEHPNIVPIHELGIDGQKRLFFSMKMVKGRSLAQVIEALREQPKTAEKEWPLSRLLTVFVGVCNALAYAHSRNVIHRDLKPANLMVGDFGEVYVMDWGLAKVLASGVASAPRGTPAAPLATVVASAIAAPVAVPLAAASSVQTARSSKLDKNAGMEADLTQDGAILGTPVYMPPEQATGNLAAIDARSDVYSLGAILYELLTLEPPVKKEGGYLAVLTQVVMGEIEPPELRAPHRARAGKVPRELAAVVMKAMAKEQAARYPSVEALRHDIERFQEGRSVSAKADTTREMLWKLVKRNKLASAFTTLLAMVLLWGFWTNWQARRGIEAEEQKRTQLAKDAVPSFVRAARLLRNEGDFKEAMTQANLALNFEPREAEAHLLRGQLLIGEQDYAAALAELETYQKLKPNAAGAGKLAELCRTARADHSGVLLALADELFRLQAHALSNRVTEQASKLLKSRNELLAHYQKRIEAAWPRYGDRLTMDELGRFDLSLRGIEKVRDLAPLQGIPLSTLNLSACGGVRDLTPLKGMKLMSLLLAGCVQIQDLTPLQGMPLTTLDLDNCLSVKDLSLLKDMPLTTLTLPRQTTEKDLILLKDRPLRDLTLVDCDQVKDLTTLRGFKLARLYLCRCQQVRDLTPLKDMPLTHLDLYQCSEVRDLAPLQGMKLTSLSLENCGKVQDLTPLHGMPLNTLSLPGCGQIRDLTPLKGIPLTYLHLFECRQVQDLSPLKNMRLTWLCLYKCEHVQDVGVLKGMPLTYLDVRACSQLHDLTPLEGMKLESVLVTPKDFTKEQMAVLRRMKSLRQIWRNEGAPLSPDDFWKKYDAGEFNK